MSVNLLFLDIIVEPRDSPRREYQINQEYNVDIEPEKLHLEMISALIQCKNKMTLCNALNSHTGYFNNQNIVTDVNEFNQLPGYQYLTNYLLLNLHDKMVKDINCQSMKIDELENLLKGGCGEISLESFFWYEKVTRFSKIINANMEKIDQLQQEILNGKKNCAINTDESGSGYQYEPHSDTFWILDPLNFPRSG